MCVQLLVPQGTQVTWRPSSLGKRSLRREKYCGGAGKASAFDNSFRTLLSGKEIYRVDGEVHQHTREEHMSWQGQGTSREHTFGTMLLYRSSLLYSS